MSYSQKPSLQVYAKLRTQPEHIHQEYEQRANKALKETVAKEQAHLQKQVDDFKEFAQGEIDKAWGEAEHWKKQVEIIYELMEQSEVEIKREREAFKVEIERLKREVERLKREKARKAKNKRILERD